MNIDWSKAPEGYPIWIEDLKPDAWKDMGGWHKEEDDKYVDEDGRFWSKPEDSFYRVYRNPNESWTGTGLPPVGTVCEYLGAHDYREWTQVNIFAVWGDQVFVDFGDGWRAEKDASRFRPIRTQEQIEAEEREKAISHFAYVLYRDVGMDRRDAELLWNKGYRKQPKEDV